MRWGEPREQNYAIPTGKGKQWSSYSFSGFGAFAAENVTHAERVRLREHRSRTLAHWNLLTGMKGEQPCLRVSIEGLL